MNDKKYPQIPEGYSQSHASVVLADSFQECDVCHMPKQSLTRMDKDYPNNPDIWVCGDCIAYHYRKGKGANDER